jgi:thiamine biosynthesis lipoprotein
MTGGLVDPTIGRAMRLAGYDRTFSRVQAREAASVTVSFTPAGRWEEIELDGSDRSVRIPPGVELDLGASAKSFAADRIAALLASGTGAGVLVALGGDIATAGPAPSGGWVVGVADDHATPGNLTHVRVALESGGLASSGVCVRRWRTTGGEQHHILDPHTGRPATGPWTTATVAAASCLDANAASTAAIILGARAPEWLAVHRLPARLARPDGTCLCVGGWPEEQAAA